MNELDILKKISIINIEKTVTMFFLSNQFRLQNKPQVFFNNTEIAIKSEVRLLRI